MFRTLPATFDPSRAGPRALLVVGAEWCGYCQQFKPELKKMESQLKGVRVYWVDGDSDGRVADWKVDGFPTVLYRASQGGLYKYNGQRSADGIKRFIESIES